MGYICMIQVIYLQKISHDVSLLGLLHYGYQALCRVVCHVALGPPGAILLMLTI